MPGVFDLMPAPDWAATTTIATENAAGHTPEEWARAIFDPRTVPPWVGALFAVRQTAVKALGIPRGGRWMLAVSRVTSDEAIIDTDDRHLRFVAAVTAEPHLVHVTTAVTLCLGDRRIKHSEAPRERQCFGFFNKQLLRQDVLPVESAHREQHP